MLLYKVSELINHVTGRWDEELVYQTFCNEDDNLIMQLQVNESADDNLAWHYDKKGLFTVKSAYKVAMDIEAKHTTSGIQSGSNSTSNSLSFDWMKLWKIPLPSKIRLFLWRLAHHNLPWRQKLIKRGMEISVVFLCL